jgi:heterodisulfide reductase subunit A
MGAGFTLAAGVARTTGQRTMGFLGDSTFFHSGMPALLNAIKEDVNMVAVIMDNEVTAMTGFQESPGIEVEGGQVKRSVDIEAVVRALGARHVETIDPNDLTAAVGAFERAKQQDGLSVVISHRACPIFFRRAVGKTDVRDAHRIVGYRIDHDRCRYCGRSSCGQRCDQGVVVGFERVMVRARSLEIGQEHDRPPVAPCATKCPLYLCIQGYAAHIAAGRYADALELIMTNLPLPDTVCRVCHRPCESVCVRGGLDQPVAINELKRFVLDWADAQDEFPYRPSVEPRNGMSVAIVGAGPAGLAAAHELARRGYEVRLLDAKDEPGGLLLTAIPGYRLPREALRRDVQRILDLGVSFEGGRRLGADLPLADLLETHDAVLLAFGSGKELELDLPGQGPEIVQALAYLRNDFAPARHVVVIGGGNAAVDAARTAVRRGAERVVIACLEGRDGMPAIPTEIVAAEEEGIEIRGRVRALRLVPDGVEVVKVEARVPGNTDPGNYEPVPGTNTLLAAHRVIVAIGQVPDETVVAGVALDWSGGLRVDPETRRTSHPRIFAAGDLLAGERSVTDAIAGGLRAAWGIDRALRGVEEADRRLPPPRVPSGPPVGRPGVRRSAPEERRSPVQLDRRVRVEGFSEIVGVLTEQEARAEAARCMICGLCGNCSSCLDLFGCPAFFVDDGRVEIDPNLCVACGVCVQFCPNDAIVPVFERVPAGGPR